MKNLKRGLALVLCISMMISVISFLIQPSTAIYGERITVSGSQFFAGGDRIWINGANTPWDNWNDFGGNFDANWWTNHFQELRDNGINTTRVWITCSGEVGININESGYVSGATDLHWQHLDSLFQIAQTKGVYIKATLMSFDHFKNTYSTYNRWRNWLTSTSNIDSYINNYLIPFVNRYKNNPYLWSIDLMNEPDWVYEQADCGQISWDWLQTYFAKAALAIHSNSSILTTVDMCMVKYMSDAWAGNKLSNSALAAKAGGDSRAKVDFYSPHHYDWMDSVFGNPHYMSPGAYGMDTSKPAVIGELPARGTSGHSITDDYESAYVNGWQGAMAWTSNGVDSNGSLAELGPATRTFKNNHAQLVYPGVTIPDPTTLPALPNISRNVPAFAQHNNQAAPMANDSNYSTYWRSNAQNTPTWLAYDLSSVPSNQRGNVVVAWYNGSYGYDKYPSGLGNGYSMPKSYNIEVNNAAGGGAAPTSGWVVKATVNGNLCHSRQHAINMSGYNWLRINITQTSGDGSGYNDDVNIQMDVHNAANGVYDDWLFLGDSITAGGMTPEPIGSTGTFAQLINSMNSDYFPVQENGGIGGWQSKDPLSLGADGQRHLDRWLSQFPGRYVTYSFGTNDAGWAVNPNTYYSQMKNAIDTIIAAGKVPVIPKIPWARGSGYQNNIPGLNAKIDQLYAEYGTQIVKGPDLWSFLQSNQAYISSDNLHPTSEGYAAIRQLWASKMILEVYEGSDPTPTPTPTPTPSPQPQSPYTGTPYTVPGTIQSENFDKGEEGEAYHDSDIANSGGEYRSTGVDIQACSEGGYNIGWVSAGEWLEYTVNVANAGTYNINVRVSSDSSGKSLFLEFNGVNKTGNITVPNTGGWQNWQTVTIEGVSLSAGEQVMRAYFNTDSINLNYIALEAAVVEPPVQTPYGGSPYAVPGTIQAENFDVGEEGEAYHDSDTANREGQYRSTGVDIQACSEGGYNICWASPGEWLEYTINVANTGIYNINARIASELNNKTLYIEFNGVNKTGTITVPNTGGWQNWQTVTIEGVSLSAGEQVMRVYLNTDSINLNYISIEEAGTGEAVIFNDGFESGNFSSGGWTGNAPDIVTAEKYEGTYAAVMEWGDNLQKIQSTSGRTNIQVQYARKIIADESSDTFTAQWYDGSSWINLETVTGGSPAWSVKTWNLPSAANNNGNFRIRFLVAGYDGPDHLYLDNVKILGQ